MSFIVDGWIVVIRSSCRGGGGVELEEEGQVIENS